MSRGAIRATLHRHGVWGSTVSLIQTTPRGRFCVAQSTLIHRASGPLLKARPDPSSCVVGHDYGPPAMCVRPRFLTRGK